MRNRVLDAAKGILEIGKRDTTNPKYDTYFEELTDAVEEAEAPFKYPYNRETIFTVINNEREYQDLKWKKPAHLHEVESYILYMEHILQQAREAVTTQNGTYGALDHMRKVVALGMACFELHGCPNRSWQDFEKVQDQ